MTPEQETKVLESLYDRLYDAITYAPQGQPRPTRVRMLMAKNTVLNPADFMNALSPTNPGTAADQNAAAAFSSLVDAIPLDDGSLYTDSGRTVSSIYSQVVRGANTGVKPTKAQEDAYKQAYDELNTTRVIGGKRVTGPSEAVLNYQKNQTASIDAITAYRSAQNGYDLSKPTDQRAWRAIEPQLKNKEDQALQTWGNGGRAKVELDVQTLSSSINDAVTMEIAQSQNLVAPASTFPNGTGGQFLLSYGLASNWADPASGGSTLTLKSSYLSKTATHEATSYSMGGHASWGLWHGGGSYSSETVHDHMHMDADDFELSAELILVQIRRPWFDPLLLSMRGWWESGQPKGYISGPDVMPMYPVAFVCARKVKVSANFSTQDEDHIQTSILAGADAGWGPFTISGSYSKTTRTDKITSTYSGGTLEFGGIQLLAWICAPTPSSPPMDSP